MIKKTLGSRFLWKSCIAILCSALLVPGEGLWAAPSQEQAAGADQQEAPKIPPDQLDSLVAPIALYPDPMLAQVLVASTYPLEIIQFQQWLCEKQEFEGQGAGGCCAKAALGSQHPGPGRNAGCGQAFGG